MSEGAPPDVNRNSQNMHRKVTVAEVWLWNQMVGAVAWDETRQIADFQYDDTFIRSGLEVAPLMMPLREGLFSFPNLSRETFRGLPGLLADSRPDRFGNTLIDVWLQQQGRTAADFTPIERLCYMGSRGMGALEFKPALRREVKKAIPLELAKLTALASEILKQRSNFKANLHGADSEVLTTIIRVGTSAGGARAKAVIAWNPETHEVRSGQVPAPAGFESWILKFDGIHDKELGEPKGFGRIEYAYYLMARAAGIEMTECRLLEEGGRAHFMTRRFDRDESGGKIHVQSLCALGHYDFNRSGEYSYEQAFAMIQKVNIGHDALREMFRRMSFNLIASNKDDHTRNIAFLMDQQGHWRLSPAFDVMWAHNPDGFWTNRHQMSVNGKQLDFNRDDLLAVAQAYGIKDGPSIIAKVGEAVRRWPEFAKEVEVHPEVAGEIGRTHLLMLAR
jgi:serine/threonine-protein kinase HipA